MSVETPWWAQSPSPYTLIYWFLLLLYGVSRFSPKGWRGWAVRLWDACLILALIIFPIDIMWLTCEWLKFGSAYPQDWLIIVLCLIRDVGMITICVLLGWETLTGPRINLKNFSSLAWAIPFYAVWFLEAGGLEVTDWTYALKMGFPFDRVLQSFLISHILLKGLQAAMYINLWRRKQE